MSSRTPKKDSQSLKKNLLPNKFFPFFSFFMGKFGLAWIRIPHPDPQTHLYPDRIRVHI
jgi:hypothetical protein